MPNALFIQANSGLNIKNGDGCFSDKGQQIVDAVFGIGPKDKEMLGEGVYNQYGIANEGFDVVSCQFALHYFFKNLETLNNFLRNVSETCALGGYFIGTAYDGKSLFKKLKSIETGKSLVSTINGKTIWNIQKMYEGDEFEDDSSSIGYGINVYQDSINKTFLEYLINFDYLTLMLKHYGFELVVDEEIIGMGLPNSTGMFEELYIKMKSDIKKEKKMRGRSKLAMNIGKALELDKDIKQRNISFLNRYFVYKKIRKVNAKEIATMMADTSTYQEELEEEATVKAEITAATEIAAATEIDTPADTDELKRKTTSRRKRISKKIGTITLK